MTAKRIIETAECPDCGREFAMRWIGTDGEEHITLVHTTIECIKALRARIEALEKRTDPLGGVRKGGNR